MVQKSLLKDIPEKLIKKYHEKLTEAGIPVEQILLFGSYAKGTAKPWSDVDICVVSPIFGKQPFDELIRLKKLTANVETLIEPVPYTKEDLQDKYDPLAAEIRTHGIRII